MIHYGKEPTGELLIRVSADEVKEVCDVLMSAGLQQRRTFYGLKRYIEDEYREQLAAK